MPEELPLPIWNIAELDVKYSVTRGISNVMSAEDAYINVRDGCILVIKNIKNK